MRNMAHVLYTKNPQAVDKPVDILGYWYIRLVIRYYVSYWLQGISSSAAPADHLIDGT